MMKFVFHTVENNVGKGDGACNKHYFLFTTVFSIFLFTGFITWNYAKYAVYINM